MQVEQKSKPSKMEHVKDALHFANPFVGNTQSRDFHKDKDQPRNLITPVNYVFQHIFGTAQTL